MTTSNNTSEPQGQADASSMAPATIWTPQKKITPRKRRRYLRYGLIGAVVAAYAVGAVYFSSHFTPNTTVDGVDASMMTTEQLAEAINQRAASYMQHVSNADGFEATIAGSDISLACQGQQVADEALSRTTPILWLPSLLSPQHMLIDAHISADEEALNAIVQGAVSSYNENAEQPTNASPYYDEEAQTFAIKESVPGTALNAEKVAQACYDAVLDLNEQVTLDSSALADPQVRNDDETLVSSVDTANAQIAHEIELQADGETIASIDRATMAGWLHFDEQNQLYSSGITAWVEGNEAIQDAGNATDDEHVWALDVQSTADTIFLTMQAATGGPIQITRYALETKPAVTPGAKERGRHIDINLTTQFVRFYDSDGTVIWDSYCVTGGWDPEYQEMHYTPTGTFAIQTKETNRTLVGADSNGDGQPDYESFVNYWMPFLNYDYGLHDATWRAEFGGDIRSWWGSHGCVNLPYDKAEELFNLVNVGDTVYVHE